VTFHSNSPPMSRHRCGLHPAATVAHITFSHP
jgi:hypothetical protein